MTSWLQLGYVYSCSTTISSRLTFTQDTMADKEGYVDLGLFCADICKVLDRGLNGRRLDELGQYVLEAIEQLIR